MNTIGIPIRSLCSIAGCGHEAEEYGMCGEHFTSALVHGAFQYHHTNARPLHH
ncbi:hypothetical protein BBIA_0188 [Bifidobacterium biavatii DSM 23969]|uniref:Uncharacterized protein n=1 Tax=Bifidobacterium biavatii DSM 23969 TaxID=1437608 RepID=A0A086ZNF4_9BIFI|nr:hypothetical protein BBIA_0188 [Bifidobacterium biavatii DSM 23969]